MMRDEEQVNSWWFVSCWASTYSFLWSYGLMAAYSWHVLAYSCDVSSRSWTGDGGLTKADGHLCPPFTWFCFSLLSRCVLVWVGVQLYVVWSRVGLPSCELQSCRIFLAVREGRKEATGEVSLRWTKNENHEMMPKRLKDLKWTKSVFCTCCMTFICSGQHLATSAAPISAVTVTIRLICYLVYFWFLVHLWAPHASDQLDLCVTSPQRFWMSIKRAD